jgi:hypothetical protein
MTWRLISAANDAGDRDARKSADAEICAGNDLWLWIK